MRQGSNTTRESGEKSGAERRRHKRFEMKLNVRFLLDDGSEHSGVLSNISVGGMAINCDVRPAEGSNIIAYVQELGRLEGVVSRVDDMGFAVRLTLSAMRREKLEERLGTGKPRGAEARRHSREATSSVARIMRADGRELPCRVIDLSLGGVSLETAEWPPLGEEVMVGKMRGKVVRHHELGIAIEFIDVPPSRGSLAERLTASSRTAA
jgi:hypothetical protein